MSEYIQEWEKLSVLCEASETEEMRVGKVMGGLREDFRRKLELTQNLTHNLAY